MMRGKFKSGEIVSVRSGGGGYGDPFDRDPKGVRDDVMAGAFREVPLKNSMASRLPRMVKSITRQPNSFEAEVTVCRN